MSEKTGHSAEARDGDRRVQKTRAALRAAFNELILAKGYEAIVAADLAAHANVGRSTFYEHFQGKEDILAESLAPILAPLADACVSESFDARIGKAVEHFWENRRLARALLSGRARLVVSRLHASLIEARLSANPACIDALPSALAATQLAHAQLALIDEWLSGRYGCPAEVIAKMLHASSYAAAKALQRG